MASLAGRQSVQLDERGRISFPAQFRAVIGEQLYVSPDSGYRHFLVVRSEEGYQQEIERLRAQGREDGEDPEEIEDNVRDFSMFSAVITIDKNGRITIPKELKEYAGLDSGEKDKGKAVILGVGSRVEIWQEKAILAYDEKRRLEKEAKRRQKDAERSARLKQSEEIG